MFDVHLLAEVGDKVLGISIDLPMPPYPGLEIAFDCGLMFPITSCTCFILEGNFMCDVDVSGHVGKRTWKELAEVLEEEGWRT